MTLLLIDKKDNVEKVRDAICSILATETVHQQLLATQQGKDPVDYTFRVYRERINPFDVFLEDEDDKTPIVHVSFDTQTFDKRSSNSVTNQNGTSRFFVDCFAYAISTETNDGHEPGDEQAALNLSACVRLVRNILMHDDNKHLGLTGIGLRWISQIQSFALPPEVPAFQKIRGTRISFEVDHIESCELADENILEGISVNVRFEPDGLVVAEMAYGDVGETWVEVVIRIDILTNEGFPNNGRELISNAVQQYVDSVGRGGLIEYQTVHTLACDACNSHTIQSLLINDSTEDLQLAENEIARLTVHVKKGGT